MEKEKITENAIKAVVAIIIGLGAIISFKEFLGGIILIAIGVVIIGVDENLRGLFIKLVGFLWGKITEKPTQEMRNSPGGLQAQRDAIVGGIVNTGEVIQNITISRNQENYDKKIALKIIYKKMIKPLESLNLAANVGVKEEKELEEISKDIMEFKRAKMENELEFDEDLLKKLNEVLGRFRYTLNELTLKVNKKKFNEGLNGTASFDFITKCNEATEEIKKRLNNSLL